MKVKVYINKETGDAVQLLMTRAEFQELENGVRNAPLSAFLNQIAAADMLASVLRAGDALREVTPFEGEVDRTGVRP